MRGGLSIVTKRAYLALATGALVLGLATLAPAQRRDPAGYATLDPAWHFTQPGRRVKVVLIAGSIGAFRDHPYGRLIHEWCEDAEIRNVSRVGQGAPQLYAHFRAEVIENPRVPLGARGTELWLLFGGGLNSAGTPQRTNRAIRQIFELAYQRRVGVVALTLTPWGSDDDPARWSGARGLRALRSTRSVVDFVMGRATPAEALGGYARERRRVDGPHAHWIESERPNVAIDLYDSPLRHRTAEPWPIERTRAELASDPAWRREVAALSDAGRAARLERDARELAEAPRYFLDPSYRGFDHIHPNRAGHRVIAETMCPQLPASWGCACPPGGSP